MKFLFLIVAACSMPLGAVAFAAPVQVKRPRPVTDRPVVVPFVMKRISGNRPVITVRVNETPFQMVIHSNAGFFMQIHHALAGKVGVRDVQHAGTFGIESKGKLSSLGRDEARLRRLTIGGRTYADVPVSIFETPGDQDSGMLGLDWIHENRIIMNYAAGTVRLNPSVTSAQALRRTLLTRGYVAIPMTHDLETKRYSVQITIGSASRKMDVSTVAETDIDEDFARAAGLGVGRVIGIYGGPKGSTGRVYAVAKPVTFSIGSWRSAPIGSARIEDVYAYASKERPQTGAIGGQLATDVLIPHGAVIDFGNNVLYLRRPR